MTRNTKITFEEANIRFVQQGRTDIKLCEEGYTNWTNKCKFYDLVLQDYFWSIPKSVYKQKSAHPKRSLEKRKQNSREKYGVDFPNQTKELREKISNTHKNKSLEDKQLIRQKTINTNLKKFGHEAPLQSPEIQEKYKRTTKNKYGVDNISQLDSVKQLKQKICIEKFGTLSTFQSSIVQEKIKKVNLEKYGKENPSQKYVLYDSKESLKNWIKKQSNPKPAYSTIQQWLLKEKFCEEQITTDLLTNFLVNYKNSKTSLETLVETNLGIKHFNNKVVKELKYRPDFKINETTYLNADGLYWHSEKQKNKYYHYKLREEFENNGLTIYQFYENEITAKLHIIKSILKNATNNNNIIKGYHIRAIDKNTLKQFITQNSFKEVSENTNSDLGFYVNEKLLACISYKENNNTLQLENFCIHEDYFCYEKTIFESLLNYIEKHLSLLINPTINQIHISFDLRYETGTFIENFGFIKNKETITYKWTNGRKLLINTNKNRKFIKEQTKNSWYKIYDAGQRTYIKNLVCV